MTDSTPPRVTLTPPPASAVLLPVSPIPTDPSLGEGKKIKTAACLIIGDEILNGKTHDSNSNYFAKFCFERGVALKRIEVIADDEGEIVEASRRLVQNYDFIITSGGIGPTHDDITYSSLATAFNLPLALHQPTVERMHAMSQHLFNLHNQTQEQKTARNRMALVPEGQGAEALFVCEDLWVPVVRLQEKLCVLPGVPSLFRKLLDNLVPYLSLPLEGERSHRKMIFTQLPESSIAPYLTSLQERVKSEGIQVGSYPSVGKGVTVSLIGKDPARLAVLGEEVAKGIEGQVVELPGTPQS
ncbi:hypothetical protein FRC07_002238 [Ceratobasidium sp. 392]|nr:hypothetical protein FRC07_002238 [Ceratobasidium sp. 392]